MVVGFLILAVPLILVELSRPRDWLRGGLFLFLGLCLLVENDLLRSSINVFVIPMSILYGIMILEIGHNRWFQLSFEEKRRIASLERWFESFKQLGQILTLLVSGFLKFFKSSSSLFEKPSVEKKWVRPELINEESKKVVDQSESMASNKVINRELTENEETS